MGSALGNTITGNTTSDNTNGIKLSESSNNNTLTDNTSSNNTDHGIYLYWSSDNTLTGNTSSGNNYGIYLYDSSNNTLTGNTTSNNNTGIYLDGHFSNNNTLTGNTTSNNTYGIYLYSSSNNTLTGNTSSNNNYGIYLGDTSSGNTAYHNNITGNTTSGVNNATGNTFDAILNWWGAKNGPGGVGPGSGDDVSANVTFNPWLGASVLGTKIATTDTGTVTISATAEADTVVEKQGSGTPTVYIAKLSGNPKSSFSGFLNEFIDVHFSATTDVTEVTIKLYYHDSDLVDVDESTLKMKYWDGSKWANCSDTGVETAAVNGYSGYIWAKLRSDTTPNLDYLMTSSFGAGGSGNGPDVTSVAVAPVTTNESITTVLSATITQAVSPATNVITAEYFFDGPDPGTSNGTTFPSFAASTSVTISATFASADLAALSEGQHVVYVRGKNAVNNWGPMNWFYFTIDRSDLIVSIDSPAEGAVFATGAVTVTGHIFDATSWIASIEYSLDGATWVSIMPDDGALNDELVEDFTIPLSSLSDDLHVVIVRATDAASTTNVATNSVSFTTDTNNPNIVLNPQVPSPVSSTTVTLTGNASDTTTSIATVTYQLDGGDWYSAGASDGDFNSKNEGFSIYLSGLSEGAHTVVAKAYDTAGNTSTTSTDFFVDTTAPIVDSVSVLPDPTSGATCTLTVSIYDPIPGTSVEAFEYFYDENDKGFGKNTIITNFTAVQSISDHTISITADIAGLAEGSHTIHVRGMDTLGNWGTTNGDEFIVARSPIVAELDQVTSPTSATNITISGFLADMTNSISWASINISPSGSISPAVLYSLTDTDLDEGVFGDTLVVKFSKDFTFSAAYSTTYTVVLSAEDNTGRPVSTSISFRRDVDDPFISLIGPGLAVSDKSVTLTGVASDDTGVARVVYKWRVNTGTWSEWSLAEADNHPWKEKLEPYHFELYFEDDGWYEVEAMVVDEVGLSATAATAFRVDTTGPVVPSVTVAPDPTSGATCTLTVSIYDPIPGTSVEAFEYFYDENDKGFGKNTIITNFTAVQSISDHTISITADIAGLAEGSHTIHVRGMDTFGNWGTTNGDEFIVARSPIVVVVDEVQPDPLPISSVTIVGRAGGTSLSAMDKISYSLDGATYTTANLFIDEGVLGRDTNITFHINLTGLSDGSHTITVKVVDAAVNTGYGSDTFVVDTHKPIIHISPLNNIITLPSLSLPFGPVTDASGNVYYEVYEQTIEITATISDATTLPVVVIFDKITGGKTKNIGDRENISGDNPWNVTLQYDLSYDVLTTFVFTAYDVAGNTTSSSVTLKYVPITGDRLIGQKIIGSYGGTVEGSDGTKVGIPVGALNLQTLISIRLVTGDRIPFYVDDGLPAGIKGTPFARRFEPEDLIFLKFSTITIPYTQGWIDAVNADGAGIDESKLALFAWDGMTWNRVESEVDQDKNTVAAKVNHLGLFRIMEDTRGNPGFFDMYLTNNPFSPNGDGRKDSTVFIYELPQNGTVTIKIYDMAGDLVKVLAEGIGQGAGYYEVTWNGDNDFANYVGSGIYVFKLYVKFNDGSTKTVMKPVGVIK